MRAEDQQDERAQLRRFVPPRPQQCARVIAWAKADGTLAVVSRRTRRSIKLAQQLDMYARAWAHR